MQGIQEETVSNGTRSALRGVQERLIGERRGFGNQAFSSACEIIERDGATMRNAVSIYYLVRRRL